MKISVTYTPKRLPLNQVDAGCVVRTSLSGTPDFWIVSDNVDQTDRFVVNLETGHGEYWDEGFEVYIIPAEAIIMQQTY